jgi:hypothetical protein
MIEICEYVVETSWQILAIGEIAWRHVVTGRDAFDSI